MWMNDIPITVFDFFGRQLPIKDIKDIAQYTNFINVDVSTESTIDEVCVRNDIYGEQTEDQSYKIFEANIVELTDNNFSMSVIKSLRIPLS